MHEPLNAARKRLNIAKPTAYLRALDVCQAEGLVIDQIGLAPNEFQAAA